MRFYTRIESKLTKEPNLDYETPRLCVDRETGLVYEAKLHETHALVRPVSPALYSMIERVPLHKFGERFDDFYGDPEEVQAFVRVGRPVMFTAETKH
jgi:hypothetical protein